MWQDIIFEIQIPSLSRLPITVFRDREVCAQSFVDEDEDSQVDEVTHNFIGMTKLR